MVYWYKLQYDMAFSRVGYKYGSSSRRSRGFYPSTSYRRYNKLGYRNGGYNRFRGVTRNTAAKRFSSYPRRSFKTGSRYGLSRRRVGGKGAPSVTGLKQINVSTVIRGSGKSQFRPGPEVFIPGECYCRVTLVNGSVPPAKETPNFNGSAWFKGFSEDVRYDITEAGPFEHRRIVVQTSRESGVGGVIPGNDNSNPPNYYRVGAVPVTDPGVADWLSLLFTDTSVSGIMTGELKRDWLRVLESTSKSFVAGDYGRRKRHKFWNNLGVTTKYKDVVNDKTGANEWSSFSADFSQVRNIYVLDFFQFGVKSKPGPVVPSVKSESSGLSGASDVLMEAVESAGTDMEGYVQVRSVMKLYFTAA